MNVFAQQAVLTTAEASFILKNLLFVCPFMLAFSKPTFFGYHSFNSHC